MSETVIKPDLKFIEEVIASGGESLKKCYQCATCSVVCNITPGDRPFPRKEMVQAQWGQKWELMRNPDIWLCHQCSDCTAYCPRGAKPGEVLGAIRKLSIDKYSLPSGLSKAVNDARFLPLLIALPAIVILGAIMAHLGGQFPSLANIARGEGGKIVFGEMMPVHFIDPIFTAAAFLATVVFVLGVTKYWSDMKRGVQLTGAVSDSLVGTVKEILLHGNFRSCGVTNQRGTSHMLVFFSFIGLAITTAWAVFYLYGLKIPSPYPLTDPLKWLGNISAIALLAGIILVVVFRIDNEKKAGFGSYYDWLFIGVVATVAVTGLFAELMRMAELSASYAVYYVHLVAVLFLFLYAPYSKMAHMVYRATAMVFAKMAGRQYAV